MTHGIPGEEFFTSFAIKISRKWNILWKWLHYNDWILFLRTVQCSIVGTLYLIYILHTLAKPLLSNTPTTIDDVSGSSRVHLSINLYLIAFFIPQNAHKEIEMQSC